MSSQIITVKIEGVEDLDIRFFSSFLYNLKVYSTAIYTLLTKKNLTDEEKHIVDKHIINKAKLFLKKKDLSHIFEEIQKDSNFLEDLFVYVNDSQTTERSYKKYEFFISDEFIIKISNIRKNCWEIKFLSSLTPEQIRAIGDAVAKIIGASGAAIAKIIIAIAIAAAIYNCIKSHYCKDLIAILKIFIS
jgi:hypothetical protein